jgi:hypothetical protein
MNKSKFSSLTDLFETTINAFVVSMGKRCINIQKKCIMRKNFKGKQRKM